MPKPRQSNLCSYLLEAKRNYFLLEYTSTMNQLLVASRESGLGRFFLENCTLNPNDFENFGDILGFARLKFVKNCISD
jgi:hypothetical protein